jgi:hypothetical protein
VAFDRAGHQEVFLQKYFYAYRVHKERSLPAGASQEKALLDDPVATEVEAAAPVVVAAMVWNYQMGPSSRSLDSWVSLMFRNKGKINGIPPV